MPTLLDDLDSRLSQLRLEPLDFMGSAAQKTVKDLSSTAVISGYLEKLPVDEINADDKRTPQFFMLDRSKLFMFPSADDSASETGNLLILSSTTVASAEEGFACSFDIKTLLDTWRLRATSETQKERWMAAITAAIDPNLNWERKHEEVSSSLSRIEATATRDITGTPVSRTPTLNNNINNSSNGHQTSTLSRPGTPTTMSRSASRRIRPPKKLPSIPGPPVVDASSNLLENGTNIDNGASSTAGNDGLGPHDFPGVHVQIQQRPAEARDDAASASSKVSAGAGGGWTLFRTRSKSNKKGSSAAVAKDSESVEGDRAANAPETIGLWRKKSFRQALSLRARSRERDQQQQHAPREE
ncbi:hypothetical protein HDU83_002450 [Entophlyctis luteolus]|nr:hypothetical protein HDU82_008597 [Entophlyctis luteolus]KAJ3347005.1 hypothetical protein HDU83_002450 [Entophlyctis luteolus]